ncbi:MAG: WXG100 family type VII secretion target [Ruminiclostridium sp.]|nr:WXG100 family type VII secretion target [Ruminiclostridium sp.]
MAANEAIKYSFDTLDQCSTKMGNVVSTVNDITQTLTNLRDGVNSFWEGKAQKAYVERSDELFKKLGELYEELDKSKKKLDSAIAIQRANEEALTGDVNKLSDDDIF